MARPDRVPEATVRLIEWSDAHLLDLDDTASRFDAGARRRLTTSTPAAARRFLIGRALLARTVAELVGADEAAVIVTARCRDCGLEHGRPVVHLGDRIVHASVSHTDGSSAVAVSQDGPVGIDLERIDPDRFAGVEHVGLSPTERKRWARLPHGERLRFLAEHWTAKEAVLKALGTGLRVDPATIELPPQPRRSRTVTIADHRFDLQRPEVGSERAATVAVLLS